MFVLDRIFELLSFLLPFISVSFIQGLLFVLIDSVHFKFFLEVSLHVFELIVEFNLQGLTRDFVKRHVNSHRQVLGIVVLDCEECVVCDMVVILYR